MGTMVAREPHALRLDRHDTEIHERPHSRLPNPLSHRLFDANANNDCTSLFFDDAPPRTGLEDRATPIDHVLVTRDEARLV